MLIVDLLDDEVSLGLQVHVRQGAFSGTGLASFTKDQVVQFATDLRRLSEDADLVAKIEGGLYDHSLRLTVPLVQISCKCIGAGLRVRMQVRLASHPYTGCAEEDITVLSIPLEFAIHDVERFATELETLPNHLELH